MMILLALAFTAFFAYLVGAVLFSAVIYLLAEVMDMDVDENILVWGTVIWPLLLAGAIVVIVPLLLVIAANDLGAALAKRLRKGGDSV